MSAREQVQERAVQALHANPVWNAPFGILPDLRPFGKGKVRTVTFGCRASLDAELLIIRANRLELRARGALAGACPESFDSIEKFEAWAADPWGAS